jgi:hypothetical protein
VTRKLARARKEKKGAIDFGNTLFCLFVFFCPDFCPIRNRVSRMKSVRRAASPWLSPGGNAAPGPMERSFIERAIHPVQTVMIRRMISPSSRFPDVSLFVKEFFPV